MYFVITISFLTLLGFAVYFLSQISDTLREIRDLWKKDLEQQ